MRRKEKPLFPSTSDSLKDLVTFEDIFSNMLLSMTGHNDTYTSSVHFNILKNMEVKYMDFEIRLCTLNIN